ncbi:MAG: hypothetical protein CL843_11355 [Crocinitomicaceae bacterium]|nr:hypothetical protein [Crocinitomicaceae bacterium]|tara:strand:+ start:16048 stop:16236 length:189 start_codon:yes stop_codon:yes gene_type:complete
MLEMTKLVLRKVSFDRVLFKKELVKATKWLKKDELLVLQAWCLITFAGKYDDLIIEVFRNTF